MNPSNLEPAGWVLLGGVVTTIINRLYDRWINRDSADATVQAKRIEDGTTMRGELWQRVTHLEDRLEARDKEIDQLQVDNLTIKAAEDRCQGQLKALARQFVALRERVRQHLPELEATAGDDEP